MATALQLACSARWQRTSGSMCSQYTENGLETTDGYRCLPATSELDTPSTSPLQNYASSYFADTNLTLDTDAFVNACVWGSTADKLKCVKVMMLKWASTRR